MKESLREQHTPNKGTVPEKQQPGNCQRWGRDIYWFKGKVIKIMIKGERGSHSSLKVSSQNSEKDMERHSENEIIHVIENPHR